MLIVLRSIEPAEKVKLLSSQKLKLLIAPICYKMNYLKLYDLGCCRLVMLAGGEAFDSFTARTQTFQNVTLLLNIMNYEKTNELIY